MATGFMLKMFKVVSLDYGFIESAHIRLTFILETIFFIGVIYFCWLELSFFYHINYVLFMDQYKESKKPGSTDTDLMHMCYWLQINYS